jgi:5-methylcytosine-specific restriction endonuclease McrA
MGSTMADVPDFYRLTCEEMACDHRDRVLTFKVNVRGSRLFRRQCTRCGDAQQLMAADLTPREKSCAVPFDEEINKRRWEAFNVRLQAKRTAWEAERKREFDGWYARYLGSPEWAARRRAVLQRARGTCEGCLIRPATQVHHLTYAHVGNELLFELVAVCDKCHGIVHERGESRVP